MFLTYQCIDIRGVQGEVRWVEGEGGETGNQALSNLTALAKLEEMEHSVSSRSTGASSSSSSSPSSSSYSSLPPPAFPRSSWPPPDPNLLLPLDRDCLARCVLYLPPLQWGVYCAGPCLTWAVTPCRPANTPSYLPPCSHLPWSRQVLYCTVLYCIVLYCIVLYCIVLCCIVLYCIVLYCIVLYCTVPSIVASTLVY